MSFVMMVKIRIYVSNYGISCCKILGIVGSQIETEIIFSLTRILADLRRFKLQLENLKNSIFVSKN
jgi:hypothetical protein